VCREVRERRIAERDVRADRPRQERDRVGSDDRGAAGEAGRLEVLPQCRYRPWRAFDERHVRRAAGQRFDPERARACEQVEHLDTADEGLEDPEERLADAVGGRTRAAALRDHEAAAFRLARDDPHLGGAHLGERISPPERLDRRREPGVLGSLQRGIAREDRVGVLRGLARETWVDVL